MGYEHDLNLLREAIRDYFADKPPADIVPREGLTREALLELNRIAADPTAQLHQDGTLLSDDAGIVKVSAPETFTDDTVLPAVVTRDALERLGLTAQDVPNVTVAEQ